MTVVPLIDLSSIAHAEWHIHGNDANPNQTSIEIVARVRALASGNPHVAICTERGRSFRKDLDPTYKANRKVEDRAPLYHQIDVALDVLRNDGFPVWGAEGFEADDVIATAAVALEIRGYSVLVISADKDLLQLVNANVSAKSIKTGDIIDDAAVEAKYGVTVAQLLDFFALVGDASDNIKGCDGVGVTRAAGLLKKYGTLEGIYDALTNSIGEFTPKLTEALREFQPRVAGVKALLTLRTDAPVPVDDVLKERVPLDVATFGAEDNAGVAEVEDAPSQARVDADDEVATTTSHRASIAGSNPAPTHQLMVREPAPVEWERQLEPRNMAEMKALSADLFASRLFSAWGHPAAVLSIILAGREVGIPAMASLRGFHNVEGKPAMHADLIRARVLNSGVVEYFRPVERTNERATFVAKRKGDPEISLTYTIEDGRRAWSKTPAAWDASGWGKNPADMCVARASSKLARLVAPDVVHGFFSPEELEG